MGFLDEEGDDSDNDAAPSTKGTDGMTVDKVKNYWMEANELKEKMVCMLIGRDGTAKSGITLDYLTDEDIKNGKRALVIDLDGGVEPLIMSHHRERCEKYDRDVSDVFLVKNPLQETDEGNIDYKETFKTIRSGIFLAKNAWADLNIKYVVFDGLSSALKYAEKQMRLEKNIDADGGVSVRYWLRRNKIFIELMEQLKSLPISSFYIAHEDFIIDDREEMANVKLKTNAMMHQRLVCERNDDGEEVTFTATVDKSKYKTESEGREIRVATVNKETGSVDWDTSDVFDALL